METDSTSRVINVMCCGNVDDGKSSFLGRLLYETQSVYIDNIADMETASKKYSMKKEYSMLLDGLLEERRQQITIDVAHRYLTYRNARINILDCPGHESFLPGVVSAASRADCAILVIDVSKPVSARSITHLEILNLFQVKDIFVVFNKYDLIDYNSEKGKQALDEFARATESFRINRKAYFLSSLDSPGEEITGILDDILEHGISSIPGFAAHIQNCLLDGKRYYYTKIQGVLNESRELFLYPEGRKIVLEKPLNHQGVFSLKEDLDIPRGSCVSSVPLIISKSLRGKLIKWDELDGRKLMVRHGVRLAQVLSVTDFHLQLNQEIYFSNINEIRENGFCLLIDEKTLRTVGVFILIANEKSHQENDSTGGVVWITGLSGSGKTTLAKSLQKRFTNSILLDADAIRTHVNFDIGYAREDRLLNIRKIAGIAKILSDQGVMVIVACISQYREQRLEIRGQFNKFYEIFLNTPVKDSKGIYASLSRNIISGYEQGTPEEEYREFESIDPEKISQNIQKYMAIAIFLR